MSPRNNRSSVRGRSPPPIPRSPSPSRNSKSIPRDEKRESPHGASPVSDVKLEPRSDPSSIIQSVVAVKHTEFSLPPAGKKQRCRDYDEKGYCMRGDMCSFDHGSDPVVLEGISGVLDFPPPPVPGGPPTAPGYTPAPAPPQGVPRPRHPPPRHPQFVSTGEYTPRDPSLWVGQANASTVTYYGGNGQGRGVSVGPRFSAPPPLLPTTTSRELISVPVNNGSHMGQCSSGVRPSLAKRLGPAVPLSHNMSVVSKPGRPDLDSCTLELRKIPPGLNTIAHLNDHFAKFGTVVNIQVHHEGNPENALVTFNSHSEANAAYRSTEAVLNNRFIKLFWHNPQSKIDRGGTYVAHTVRPVHDRLGVRHPNKTLNKTIVEPVNEDKNEKVMISRGSLVKTVYNTHALHSAAAASAVSASTYTPTSPGSVTPTSPVSGSHSLPTSTGAVTPTSPLSAPPSLSAIAPDSTHAAAVDTKRQEIDAILKQRELLAAEVAAKHKVEKQKADALKLRSEVEQRKRHLLEKQMQQLKVLVNKLEANKANMKPEEKKVVLETIKSLQAAIESTRSQVVGGDVPKSKVQVDREILDTELELYSVQAEGGDITKLRIQLNQLRAQQQASGYLPSRSVRHSPYGLPRGGHYGRGRGAGNLGRGGSRGRGRGSRGYGHSFASVDRRTTKINASGFEREDKEEVLAHFSLLGKITNYVWDGQTPAVTIQYSTRREAEKAMSEGRTLGDRLLTLTWVFDVALPLSSQSTATSMAGTHHVSTHSYTSVVPHTTTPLLSPDETLEEITEEIVEEVETEDGVQPVLFEEEEEEVEEDEEEVRSWRR